MARNSKKMKKNAKKENNFKRLADNRYAKFQYAISETIEVKARKSRILLNE